MNMAKNKSMFFSRSSPYKGFKKLLQLENNLSIGKKGLPGGLTGNFVSLNNGEIRENQGKMSEI